MVGVEARITPPLGKSPKMPGAHAKDCAVMTAATQHPDSTLIRFVAFEGLSDLNAHCHCPDGPVATDDV